MPVPEQPVKPQLPAEVRKIFTDAVTAFPGDFAKQAQHIVRAHRPAGLPERFQPLNMSFSDWERLKGEQERLRQEAEARAREQQRLEDLAAQQGRELGNVEQARRERKRIQEQEKGEQSCLQLEQDMRNTPMVEIAEDIANSWRQHSKGAPIYTKMFRSVFAHETRSHWSPF